MGERMDAVKRAVEAALEEDVTTGWDMENRVNAFLAREGRRPTCRATIQRAMKRIDRMAYELSK